MYEYTSLRMLIWLLSLLTLVSGQRQQPAGRPPWPSPDAPRGSTRIFRANSAPLRNWYFGDQNPVRVLFYTSNLADGFWDVDRLLGGRDDDEAHDRRRYTIEHILELNVVKAYFETYDNAGGRRDPTFMRYNRILRNNWGSLPRLEGALRDDQDRQDDVISILNDFDWEGRGANIVGLTGDAINTEIARSKTMGSDINLLKGAAFQGTPRTRRAANVVGWTVGYMQEVAQAYAETTDRLSRILDVGVVEQRFSFRTYARNKWTNAMNQLVTFGIQMANLMEIDRRQAVELFNGTELANGEEELDDIVAESLSLADSLDQTSSKGLARRGPSADWFRRQPGNKDWSPAFFNAGNGVYTALGDSFSAGLGAGGSAQEDKSTSNNEQTNTTNACHRFKGSYPNLVNQALSPTRFDYFACSSDTTRELNNEQIPKIDPFSSLITVTIGGNDVDFATVAQTCVYNSPARCPFGGIATMSCCDRAIRASQEKVRTLRGTLVDTYRRVKTRAPHANILALGYPLFYSERGAPVFPLFNPLCALDQPRRKQLNDLGRELNEQIEAAAREAGISFINPDSKFAGHRFCDSLINPLNAYFISNLNSVFKKRDGSLPQHPHSDPRRIEQKENQDISDQFATTDQETGEINDQPTKTSADGPTTLSKRQFEQLGIHTSWWFHPNRRGQKAYSEAALEGIARFQAPERVDEDADFDGED